MDRHALGILLVATAAMACSHRRPDADYTAFEAQLLRRNSAWETVVRPFFDAATQPKSHPGLQLRTALLHDTVAPGEPVRLQYFLIDGPTLTLIDNSQAVGFFIFTEAGDTVRLSHSQGSLTFTEGFQGQLVLPRGAVLGQSVDLACIEIALYAQVHDCWYGYNLTQPGRYLIETRYHNALGREPGPARLPDGRPRLPGVELVDTAYLVVRGAR